MSFPTIQMLWISGALSQLEKLSILSFLHHGHPVELYVYDQVDGVPAGVRVMDGDAIVPRSELFRATSTIGKGSWGPFSDLFRFSLLHQKGGIWADADLICLKPIDFSAPHALFASEWARNPANPNSVAALATTCFISAQPNDPLIAQCLQRCNNIARTQKQWADSGPGVVQHVLAQHNRPDCVLPANTFCSVPYWNVTALFSGANLIDPTAYGIHFWNEVLRWNFFDKNGAFDRLSIFERLKAHYLDSAARKA